MNKNFLLVKRVEPMLSNYLWEAWRYRDAMHLEHVKRNTLLLLSSVLVAGATALCLILR